MVVRGGIVQSNPLNEKDVIDNKTFWKTVNPYLSDKIVSKEQIFLVENDEIISKDSKIELFLFKYCKKS